MPPPIVNSSLLQPVAGRVPVSSTPASVVSQPVPSQELTPQTQSRPPIIVPLTQLYRSSSSSTTTSTSTSGDNLIPGENSREPGAVTQSSVRHNSTDSQKKSSVGTSTTLSSASPSTSSTQSSSLTSTTTTTTTRRPSSKSSAVIPELSDNNVFNRNVESETMGSIGSIQTFDTSDSPYCPPVTFRDIRWPPTRTGAVALESCPPPTHGLCLENPFYIYISFEVFS